MATSNTDAPASDPDTDSISLTATDITTVPDPAEAALDSAAEDLMAQIEAEPIPLELRLLAEQLGRAITDQAAVEAETSDDT